MSAQAHATDARQVATPAPVPPSAKSAILAFIYNLTEDANLYPQTAPKLTLLEVVPSATMAIRYPPECAFLALLI